MIENRGLGSQSEYNICTKKHSGKFQRVILVVVQSLTMTKNITLTPALLLGLGLL